MLAGESPVGRNEDTEADARAGKEVKVDHSQSLFYFVQDWPGEGRTWTAQDLMGENPSLILHSGKP